MYTPYLNTKIILGRGVFLFRHQHSDLIDGKVESGAVATCSYSSYLH